MSTQSTVNVEVGFKGTVTGLSRAARHQRATFQIKDATGRSMASSTLVGTGENVPMKQEVNNLPVWNFGPFDKPTTITVLIESSTSADNGFVASRAIPPVTVRKEPDAASPQTYIVSTLLSEESSDNDFNDAIVSIFQYK